VGQKKKLKIYVDMLRSIGKQSVESVLKKEKAIRWEGSVEKEGFKPGVKE